MKWPLVFLVALLLLMSYSALEHDQRDPDLGYILGHRECYNQTMVTVSGTVAGRQDDGLVVELDEPPYTTFFLAVNGSSAGPGDRVEARGILNGTSGMAVRDIMVTESWKHMLIYVRSLPAIPIALYLFLRRWRFNWKTGRFEVKDA